VNFVENGEDNQKGDDTPDNKNQQEDDNQSDDDSSDDNEDEGNQEGNEDNDKGGDKVDDITKLAFSDPKKLPAELRPYAKKLQAIFSKRMTEATQSITKSRAFDRLAANPAFVEWYQENYQGEGKKKQTRQNANNDSDDDDSDDTPNWAKKLNSRLDNIESKFNRRDELDYLEKDKAQAEVFKKAHPDYKLYLDKMNELHEEYPKMSYERLYVLAKTELGDLDEEVEDDSDNDEDESEKPNKKRPRNVMKPNRSAAGDAPIDRKNNQKKGVQGAYLLAKNMLARAGNRLKGR